MSTINTLQTMSTIQIINMEKVNTIKHICLFFHHIVFLCTVASIIAPLYHDNFITGVMHSQEYFLKITIWFILTNQTYNFMYFCLPGFNHVQIK